MPKYSALTALTGPNAAAGDLICLDDVSATQSKKMTLDDLLQACLVATTKAVLDENDNEWLKFATTGSAVNELTITNAATGNPPEVSATGGDTNISVKITPKGTGGVVVTGNGAALLSVGRQGATDPSLAVKGDVASAVTGVLVTGRASGAGASLAAQGGATDEKLTIDAKGAGLLELQATGTGNVKVGTNVQLVSAGSIVDANGNEIIKSAATVGSAVNEITVTNAATGNPPEVSATGGDTNIGLKLTPKGTGGVTLTGNSTALLAVGRQGATDPAFKIDANAASCVTGYSIASAAAAGGVALTVTSSGTNESGKIDAKGSGTLTLNGTATGNVIVGTNLQHGSAKAIVDANGNESILFPATVGSAVNEITVSNAATGNAPSISATGGDTNVSLKLSAKGTGVVTADVGIVSTDPTDGIGYATGAGGAVAQATSRTTGVTINKVTGSITLVSAAGSATPATFTVTNSTVAATDVIKLSQKSGTDLYHLLVTAVGAGSFNITAFTTGGTTTEAPVINFAVLKGVAA